MKHALKRTTSVSYVGRAFSVLIGILWLAFYPMANATSLCETSASTEFRKTEVFSGITQWQINRYGNLTVGIDIDSSGGPDVAYRLAATTPQQLVETVQNWPIQRTRATVIRANSTASDYVEMEFADAGRTFVFFTNPLDCDDLGYSGAAIELRALGFNSFSSSAQDSQEHFENLASRPIFRSLSSSRSKKESWSQESVLFCMAGGPNASFCEYSMGGIGPISFGSCSIECPHPNEYACCGPGFLKNCECIGSGGNSGGGGFVDPVFGPPGEDDDDDDDDDDGGWEEAFSVPVEHLGGSG